jgi:hypothetical protein
MESLLPESEYEKLLIHEIWIAYLGGFVDRAHLENLTFLILKIDPIAQTMMTQEEADAVDRDLFAGRRLMRFRCDCYGEVYFNFDPVKERETKFTLWLGGHEGEEAFDLNRVGQLGAKFVSNSFRVQLTKAYQASTKCTFRMDYSNDTHTVRFTGKSPHEKSGVAKVRTFFP